MYVGATLAVAMPAMEPVAQGCLSRHKRLDPAMQGLALGGILRLFGAL